MGYAVTQPDTWGSVKQTPEVLKSVHVGTCLCLQKSSQETSQEGSSQTWDRLLPASAEMGSALTGGSPRPSAVSSWVAEEGTAFTCTYGHDLQGRKQQAAKATWTRTL